MGALLYAALRCFTLLLCCARQQPSSPPTSPSVPVTSRTDPDPRKRKKHGIMTTWMELVQVWVLPELIANGDLDGDRYFVCPERRIAIEEDPVEEDCVAR